MDCFCLLDVWIRSIDVLFDVQCSCSISRHTSHVTRHTSHVTRHSFDLRLWVLVLGFGYALCILMNISCYRYSIVRGVVVVCCLLFIRVLGLGFRV